MADFSSSKQGPPPTIAVVVASKGNQAGAADTVTSILQSQLPLELCLVEQSGGEIEPQLCALAKDERLRIVKAPPDGLAAARNVGVRLTDAPIIAFTDDDCVAAAGWVEEIVEVFSRHAQVALVFGTVQAAPYNRELGFIPAYEVERPRLASKLTEQATICGIGACMAIRRSAWEAVGGFDEQLGAGTDLRAAEDCDMVVRCLRAGFSVLETPDIVVTHRGFRSWAEGRAVIRGYMRGLGAVQAKMLRLGRAAAVRPTVALAWRWLFRRPVVDLNHRPPRLMRLTAFLGGAWSGLRLPIDRVTGCFGSACAKPKRSTGP